MVKREMYFEWSAANHRVDPSSAHDGDDFGADDDGNKSGPAGAGFSARSCRMSGRFAQLHGPQARSLDALLRNRAPGKLSNVCAFK